MDKHSGNLGAVIYYLDFDKEQWMEGVRHLLPDAIRYKSRPHITVLYGLHHYELDFNKLQDVVANFSVGGELSIIPEELGVFSNENDVVYLSITAPAIIEFNKHLRETFEHTNTYPHYQPHLTLGIVRSGDADDLIGHQSFLSLFGLS
ncbi:2'-5' RNA ligase family protein [Sphingobacterium sp. UGAL515B_05]|uniref:2'-5' RNA ligase family protein n=1 Tax=Sphingobacterium sp. UGAL515B_05 TaxID=2986767 RepID=UPI0029558A30|nr:2'-5' RNA ligase family protein [Sphingobacterium sp. UGAL515B_05]WON94785.1 2'-5' RNA ligase family protein [Sphingobacterium sp. UGAL515B_05]